MCASLQALIRWKGSIKCFKYMYLLCILALTKPVQQEAPRCFEGGHSVALSFTSTGLNFGRGEPHTLAAFMPAQYKNGA